MDTRIETVEHRGYKIHIELDPDPESPREWDNLGTMICSHGNYTLGDEQIDTSNYTGWDEVKQHLVNDREACIVLPLYLYDHSGITMKTTPFSCPWDSGQVGYIYVTKDEIREDFRVKRVSQKKLDHARDILIGEVETYDSYITGQVYGFTIEDENGDEIDSCCGFYNREALIEDTKWIVDHHIEQEWKRKEQKTKVYITNNVPLTYRS